MANKNKNSINVINVLSEDFEICNTLEKLRKKLITLCFVLPLIQFQNINALPH